MDAPPSLSRAHPLLACPACRAPRRPLNPQTLLILTPGILADEMGLGKTIQTIALIAWLACER